eukprot:GFKZ01004505.1.p1 GENE.GFKZ01004505.1~~GFKZ01004505.1.p1  ORF type:complete len:635 (-),score=147.41 GFKZ01004505.1:904-2808(-)
MTSGPTQTPPQIPPSQFLPPLLEAQTTSQPQPSTPQPHHSSPFAPRATVAPSAPTPSVPPVPAKEHSAAMPASVVAKTDEISDSDTQEPVVPKNKEPIIVDDSDAEDEKITTQDSADGKMRAIIERINAHSDRSDEDEDPAANDDDVDFGNQEEDATDNFKGPEKQDAKKPNGNDDADSDPQHEEPAHMDDEDEKSEEEAPTRLSKHAKGKASKAKTAKDKEPKSKRNKKEPVTKVIKKQTDTRAKGKLVRSKASAAARKKDSAKTDARVEDKETSRTRSPAKSPKASPTSSPNTKKTVAKEATRGAAKADGKARGKSVSKAAAAASKEAKPKKTITKQAATSKKPLLKKNEGKVGTAVRTYSKKNVASAGKSSVLKKTAATGLSDKRRGSKSDNKTTKKGKGKPRAVSKSSEEDEEVMEVVSDAEENSSDVEPDEDESQQATTPACKYSTIGSLACSSRDPTCTAMLDHAVQQLGKYDVVYYGPDCNVKPSAYIIGKSTKRGWGILQALVSGIPLVSDEWLSASISEGKWKPMDLYRSDKFGQSPTSVTSTSEVGHKIFDGQRVKVVSNGKDVPSIRKLLRTCGARVAETRFDVIINDTETVVDGHVNVTKKWLADSVENGVVLDYDGYLLEN